MTGSVTSHNTHLVTCHIVVKTRGRSWRVFSQLGGSDDDLLLYLYIIIFLILSLSLIFN